MPRQTAAFVENQFTQGLITEATGLNFPEKAVTETWNTRYYAKGNVKRRLGIDFEDNVLSVAANIEEGVCRSYLWKGVGDRGDMTLLVVQTGATLTFYEPDEEGSFSAGVKNFSVDLNLYKTSIASVNVADKEASMASGIGKLFVVHPYCDPIYIVYSEETDTISTTSHIIKIRDFEGVDDGLILDERPEDLSDLHRYNLFNQSWYPESVTADPPGGDPFYGNPISVFRNYMGVYPSNCDVWWYYKTEEDEFGPQVTKRISVGNSAAPKGHYIYNAFATDRRGQRTMSATLPETSSEGMRPSCVAFYAGRVWYSGIHHPKYGGNIYYTQIIERDEQIGVCHQLNDPTSETLSDLLDTDGGVVRVTGMGKATALFASGNNLVIFANNGIWSVGGSGAEGTGFVATDFSINRISSIGLEQQSSLVEAEGIPFWWTLDGIYTIKPDAGVSSITESTIKTFFQDEVPGSNKNYAQGAYNPLNKIIQWLWKSEEGTSVTSHYQYDRILEVNLITGAFYPHKWSVTDQPLNSIFCTNGVQKIPSSLEDVLDSDGVNVTDSDLVNVQSLVYSAVSFASSKFKYVAYDLSPAENDILEDPDVIFVEANGAQPANVFGGTAFFQGEDDVDYMLYKGTIRSLDLEAGTSAVHTTISLATLYADALADGLEGVVIPDDPVYHGLSGLAENYFSFWGAVLNPYNFLAFNCISGAGLNVWHSLLIYKIDSSGDLVYVGGARKSFQGLGHITTRQHDLVISANKDISDPILSIYQYGLGLSARRPAYSLWPALDTIIGDTILIADGVTGNKTYDDYIEGGFYGDENYPLQLDTARINSDYFWTLPFGSNTRTYLYVGQADVAVGTTSTFVSNYGATYPSGYIGYLNWGELDYDDDTDPPDNFIVANGTLDNAVGTNVFPFNERALYADNVTTHANAYGEFDAKPTVTKLLTGTYAGEYLVLFTQLLQDYTVDQMTGTLYSSYCRVKGFIWDGSSGIFEQVFNVSGMPFDRTTDFGTNDTVLFRPANAKALYHEGTGGLYIFGSTFDTNTNKNFLTKLGEITFGTTGSLAFLEEIDTDYVDFAASIEGGVSFDSYFLSGAKVHGEGHKVGNIDYITVFGNTEEDASAYLRARWDWSNSSSTGKWSTEQQVYSVNRDNRDVSRKRLLVRGSGPALQLYVRSEIGKPFDLIGWTSQEGIDGAP